MGKKSKKNIGGGTKLRAKAAIAGPYAAPQDETAAMAAEEIGSGTLISTGKKLKLNCVRCFCNLKDLAKAHQCPGCSLLYCWRCERKCFDGCPNGDGCVHPIRRCLDCIQSATLNRAIGQDVVTTESGSYRLTQGEVALFQERIRSDDRLGRAAMPFNHCACGKAACNDCFVDPAVADLLRCAGPDCVKSRCRPCNFGLVMNPQSSSREAMYECCDDVTFSGARSCNERHIQHVRRAIREARRYDKEDPDSWDADEADYMAECQDCKRSYCYECLDGRSIDSLARTTLTTLVEERMIQSLPSGTPYVAPGAENMVGSVFQCNTCYWSAKPCTNPTCPNEIGVPTKRCGGCHIDRYCSVDCQAAAYPDHAARCKKIQDKRLLEAEKDDCEDRIGILSGEGTSTDEDSCNSRSSDEGESNVSSKISSSEEEEMLPDDKSDNDGVVHKDLFEEFYRDYGYGCVSM